VNWAARQVNSLVAFAPCPTFEYPIREDESEMIFNCTRCKAVYHEPCFWRVLPIADFLEHWCWLRRFDDEHFDERREYICAACRQHERK